jgi:N-acetylglucosaminyldiphosphoundecaprenol N-acetyl-beta-D-mannosaminyltransferase
MVKTPSSLSLETVDVLGIPVSCLSMKSTVERLEELITGDQPHLVATADSSGIAIAQSDSDLLEIYRQASLVTCDSNGVVWAIGRKGKKVERVSGVDVADELCQLSAEKGYGIYLLGAEPGVANVAAEGLRLKYPGCHIVGTHDGFFPATDDLVVAEEVASAKPHILFVAMGIPRQEKFIYATMDTIGARVAMGVGGSLDVFSGRAKRAPKIVQRMKLEWLWRLILNPRKWRKAMMLPKFAWYVFTDKSSTRGSRSN